ncbi:MAG: hypothetical protein HC851_13180 [Acaryochloris sp. RU_4_1]|nr:hypothetical protein [Acaryochloris sp. SU_5_25]NJM66534.1 hypothetical protein [Acaryochloris sp. RU_4_1]NJN38770.1 hypothetical protein [Acaryochloridaceae cyanobacterium CSU_3_4]NJR54322.1 hypothetical protein [Acaryochloris sp. CRU_2_0]
MSDSDLAHFQDSLLDILSSQSETAEILASLKKAQFGDAIADYLESFDPKMVAVAAELVKQWGKR